MQKITIEVKDGYFQNIMSVLQGLRGIIINKINFEEKMHNKRDEDIMIFQEDAMRHTWNNDEDKAWDAL